MTRVWVALQNTFSRDNGATLVEYALLLVLIAIVAIGALTLLGGNVSTSLNEVGDCIGDVSKCPTTTVGG